ncbi:MAG: hypothetical protein QOD41_3280, partial [Cryptosporangiaceae bacterium]|nr:hypothetical protein [Cryptosporangiaceae bacterium]
MYPRVRTPLWRVRNTAIGVTVLGLVAVAAVSAATAANAAPGGLERIGVRESLLATYTWYRQ